MKKHIITVLIYLLIAIGAYVAGWMGAVNKAWGLPLTVMWTVTIPIVDWNDEKRTDLIALCESHRGWYAITEQHTMGRVVFECIARPDFKTRTT